MQKLLFFQEKRGTKTTIKQLEEDIRKGSENGVLNYILDDNGIFARFVWGNPFKINRNKKFNFRWRENIHLLEQGYFWT